MTQKRIHDCIEGGHDWAREWLANHKRQLDAITTVKGKRDYIHAYSSAGDAAWDMAYDLPNREAAADYFHEGIWQRFDQYLNAQKEKGD